ncbi:hypothetical protein TNCV_2113111 [Trichonephila clavipes]|nr:hypothetical protein TNCV_2113111 [Trichonephila clavipes]
MFSRDSNSEPTALKPDDMIIEPRAGEAASPFVWLVEREKRWKAFGHSQGVLPQNWGGTEQNCTAACMVLKAKANDRGKNLSLCSDEFRGP